jgi:acetolactate synthase-1/2/3 large subunit
VAKLTASQIVAQTLKSYGVEYVAGIPGHGIWTLTDAFLDKGAETKFIQVFHEQSAVHLADGYYRACGRPMAAVTSIGAGASNTVIGMATALSDSTSLMLITGGPPTHMRGHGLLQELDRHTDNGLPKVSEAVSKRSWVATRVEEIPFILHRAWSSMMTGRRGPVQVEIPFDVQAEAAEVNLHSLPERLPVGSVFPDPAAIALAVAQLNEAQRPVMVVGGGVITSEAAAEVLAVAESWQMPVVTTLNGKGGIAEDHPLFAGNLGQTGTTCGNKIAAGADVLIAVGCRFTDWTSSSYAKGVTFAIPPSRLIHIDIDPREIGKNYPVAVGIVSDAKQALVQILAARPRKPVSRPQYMAQLSGYQKEWETQLATRRDSDRFPFTSQRPIGALRKIFPRNTIIVSGSGNTQGAVRQTFPVYSPRTHITSGGFSPMGWAVPAAIGAKLAVPDAPVVCILGDGDFLMTLQEIAICVTNNIPVVFVVQNNAGYMSIRGGQRKQTSRHIGSEFNTPDGKPYTPDYEAIGTAFGLKSWRVERSEDLEPILRKALEANAPVLIEVPTDRDAAGPWVPGWWDFPLPAYITDERREEYWKLRNSQQHL